MAFYAFVVFLSAFLLFQVEPLIAKYILPWFGGTTAVWSTSLLFFQALLTGGYAYAYWLNGHRRGRREARIHLVLLGASAVVLLAAGLVWRSPIMPDASWKPTDVSFPALDVLRVLAVSVGLPYFVLSTNSPLMQSWFSRDQPGRSPYRLYALSNVGSLLALVTYPVLVEPVFTLSQQGWFWSIGYLVFAGFAGAAALRILRSRADLGTMAASPATPEPGEPDLPPSRSRRLLWVLLPACASVLLLAITSQMTQQIAVIPFLWILPLTVYLLSFILCFESDRWYSRALFTLAFFVVSGIVVFVMAAGPNLNLIDQIAIYALLLFVCCMICQGELARLRPHPRHLTSFYLLMSIGGAVGGLVVSLLAPVVFKGFWELPLGLILCAALLFAVTWMDRRRTSLRQMEWTTSLLLGAMVLLAAVLALYVKASVVDSLEADRNFYGVLQVNEFGGNDPERHGFVLVHGATSHGAQFTASDKRGLPTTYYTEKSGIGLALLNEPKRPGPLRIGVLGLGIGILAAYTQPGDVIRFYEINPDVIRLAEGQGGFFTYLKDTRGQVEIVPGDARISLEQELAAGARQRFDLLVLDTFNGDSLPVHLLTREAFELYLQHLQPDGILAVHISNNYLDLRPVVYSLADEFQMGSAVIQTPADGDRASLSIWVLATRDKAFLQLPAIASRTLARPPEETNGIRLWTDDYSNLFQILR